MYPDIREAFGDQPIRLVHVSPVSDAQMKKQNAAIDAERAAQAKTPFAAALKKRYVHLRDQWFRATTPADRRNVEKEIEKAAHELRQNGVDPCDCEVTAAAGQTTTKTSPPKKELAMANTSQLNLTKLADATLAALSADKAVPNDIRLSVEQEITDRDGSGETSIAASFGRRQSPVVRDAERRAREFTAR